MIIAVCILAVACTAPPAAYQGNSQQQAAQGKTGNNPAQPAMVSKAWKFYNYQDVSYYKYRQITTMQNGSKLTSFVHHYITSDSYNSIPAWKVESELLMESQKPYPGIRGYNRMLFAKSDDKCLNSVNILENNGQVTETAAPCGPTTTTGNNPQPVYYAEYGSEQAVVGAGTFNAKKVGLEGAVMYFIADGVPVPVKMAWGSGPSTIYFELDEWN